MAGPSPFHLVRSASGTSVTATNPLALLAALRVDDDGPDNAVAPDIVVSSEVLGDASAQSAPAIRDLLHHIGGLSEENLEAPRSTTSRSSSSTSLSEFLDDDDDLDSPEQDLALSAVDLSDAFQEEQQLAERAKQECFNMDLDGQVHASPTSEAAAPRMRSLYAVVAHVIAAQRFVRSSSAPATTKPSTEAGAPVEYEKNAAGHHIISSGTVDGLIDLFATDGPINMDFVHEFLSTYRYFMTAEELLDHFERRYVALPLQGPDAARSTLVRLRLLNVLRKWLWRHPRDFEKHPAVEARVRELVKAHALPNAQEKKFGQSLLELLDEKTPLKALRTRSQHINAYIDSVDGRLLAAGGAQANGDGGVSSSTVPLNSELVGKSVTYIKAKHLAQHLTLIESEMFRRIDESEMVMQVWSKKNRCYAEAPNLMRLIGWFNHVSYWAATEVCSGTSTRQRAATLKHLIEVAHFCLEWKNYAAVFELVCGLSLGAVTRLHKTWKALSAKTHAMWDELNTVVHPQENFQTYRKLLRAAAGPVVPYIGVHLTDLTFAEDGSPTLLSSGRVNFFKFHLVGGILNNFLQHQQEHFAFKEDPRILGWLQTAMNPATIERLSSMSRVCEPPKDT